MIRHLPNLLSALRLALAPFAAWAVIAGHDTLALSVFAVAGLSDLLDGQIARRWGFTSRFGAWLDPVADKLLMLFCFLALWKVAAAPVWLVTLVLSRDLVIAAGIFLAWAWSLPMKMAALGVGKATTAAELLYIGAALLLLALDSQAPIGMLAFAAIVGIFVAASASAYGLVFLRALFWGRRAA